MTSRQDGDPPAGRPVDVVEDSSPDDKENTPPQRPPTPTQDENLSSQGSLPCGVGVGKKLKFFPGGATLGTNLTISSRFDIFPGRVLRSGKITKFFHAPGGG